MLTLTPNAPAERVCRIHQQCTFPADKGLAGDGGYDAVPASSRAPVGPFEHAADDALLPPERTLRKLSVRGQAGEFRAGPGPAGRAIVGAAWAQDEIPAIQRRVGGDAEEFDVIDFFPVRPGDVLRGQRMADCPAEQQP